MRWFRIKRVDDTEVPLPIDWDEVLNEIMSQTEEYRSLSFIEGLIMKISLMDQVARQLQDELRTLNEVYKKYVKELEELGVADEVFDEFVEYGEDEERNE